MKARQTIFDISLQNCGAAESAYKIAIHNDISLTEEDAAKVKIKDGFIGDKRIVEYYKNNGITPATGGLHESETYLDGYWVHKDTGVITYFTVEGDVFFAPSWKLDCKEVRFPKNIRTIALNAFSENSALTEIILPDNILSLENGVFFKCVSIVRATLSKNLKKLSRSTFNTCIKLEEVVIPEGIEEILPWCFIRCDSFKSLQLPNTVKVLHDHSLQESRIKKINLPASVDDVGDKAFYLCKDLEEISVSELHYSINLNSSNKINKKSILDMFYSALSVLPASKVIKLHADVRSKLTDEEIKIVKAKGYIIK